MAIDQSKARDNKSLFGLLVNCSGPVASKGFADAPGLSSHRTLSLVV